MNAYSLSRWSLLAGVVLSLVLVVPVAWFPLSLGKVTVMSLALLISAGLFVWSGSARDLVRSWGLRGALLVVLLPLAYAVSWAFSTDKTLALFGAALEVDTALFVATCTLAYLLSFAMFRTLRGAQNLLSVVFYTLVAAILFQCAVIVLGEGAIPFAGFADRSVNLIGKWNDLGLMSGLLLLFALIKLEFNTLSKITYGLLVALCAVLVLLLGIINFSLPWTLVLAGAVVLAILKFLSYRGQADLPPLRRAPRYALGITAIAIAFLFFGTAFNTKLTSVFPVSSLEVRPSYSSTLSIIDAARGSSLSRLLVGTGPGTFGEAWLKNKPQGVNLTPFWNLDFNVGFSILMTALGSVGLLGVVAWLIPLLLLIAALIRAVRAGALGREDMSAALSLSLGTFFLWAGLLLYVPSQTVVLLSFVVAGSAFAYLWRQGRPALPDTHSRYGRLSKGAAATILLLAVLVVAVMNTKLLLAESRTNQGAAALQAGNSSEALRQAERAASFADTTNALRLRVAAGTLNLRQIAATTTQSSNLQQIFASAAQKTLEDSQKLIAKAPQDYRSYVAAGDIYAFLASLQISGALENARTAYDSAAKLNPQGPSIPLSQARLEIVANNVANLQKYLSQALTLKQDYTDAILLVVQLNVANNDLPNAVQASLAAVRSAPGVPSLWFQLGVLYYASRDSKNATAALEQALALQSDYANAKYFLGLSYWAEERREEAVRQFEDLVRTNPDNTEVLSILQSMRAGTQPRFPNPPTGETAPVDQ